MHCSIFKDVVFFFFGLNLIYIFIFVLKWRVFFEIITATFWWIVCLYFMFYLFFFKNRFKGSFSFVVVFRLFSLDYQFELLSVFDVLVVLLVVILRCFPVNVVCEGGYCRLIFFGLFLNQYRLICYYCLIICVVSWGCRFFNVFQVNFGFLVIVVSKKCRSRGCCCRFSRYCQLY